MSKELIIINYADIMQRVLCFCRDGAVLSVRVMPALYAREKSCRFADIITIKDEL